MTSKVPRYQIVKHIAWAGVATSFGPDTDLGILRAYEHWAAMFRQFDALYLAALGGHRVEWVLTAVEHEGGWEKVEVRSVPEEVARLFGSTNFVACRRMLPALPYPGGGPRRWLCVLLHWGTMPSMVIDSYSSKRVVALAGVTFRQIDYWSRTGVIPDTSEGSGSRRRFTADEVVLASLAAELSDSNGSASLAAVREHRDHLLEMLAARVELIAVVGGRFVDVTGAGSSVPGSVRRSLGGAASWTVIDVLVLRARIESRRAAAASTSLNL